MIYHIQKLHGRLLFDWRFPDWEENPKSTVVVISLRSHTDLELQTWISHQRESPGVSASCAWISGCMFTQSNAQVQRWRGKGLLMFPGLFTQPSVWLRTKTSHPPQRAPTSDDMTGGGRKERKKSQLLWMCFFLLFFKVIHTLLERAVGIWDVRC